AVVFDLQQNRETRRGLPGEVDPNCGLHRLRFAGGLQVRIEDQIVFRIKTKREPRWLYNGRAAWLPKEKVAVGIERLGLDLQFHSGEATAGRAFLAARRLSAVYKKIGVMHKALVAGMDFDGLYEARGIYRRAENEIPIDVAAAGGNGERCLRLQNQIGSTKLPAGTVAWIRRSFCRIALRHAGVHPLREEAYFLFGKVHIFCKLQAVSRGEPGRHQALPGHV